MCREFWSSCSFLTSQLFFCIRIYAYTQIHSRSVPSLTQQRKYILYQSTREVVHTSINIQGIMCGSWSRAVKPGNTQSRTKELSHGNSTSFQYQKQSFQRGHLTACTAYMKWIPIDRISGVNNQLHCRSHESHFCVRSTIVRTTRESKQRPIFTVRWVLREVLPKIGL
jgi:hypothetical protein